MSSAHNGDDVARIVLAITVVAVLVSAGAHWDLLEVALHLWDTYTDILAA